MILKIIKDLFRHYPLPNSFSEERYMTAYPDCKSNPKKHYQRKGGKEGRIAYLTEDMGEKKEIPTNETPLISFVVTSYNYEKFIGIALDSLLSQTYKNFEVIVVDDGSKDNSVSLIEEYANMHNQIHLFFHEDRGNHGLPSSMLLAISKARGQYIAFCESDDYLHPEYMEKKVHIINKYKDVVIISNAIKMFGDEKSIEARGWVCQYIRKLLKQGGTPIDLRYNQSFNFIPTLSSVMIRTDILRNLDFNTPIPAWIDFWLYRQILIKYPLYFVDEELTFWRQHDSYNSLQNSSKMFNQLGSFLKKNNKLIGL